MSYSPSFESCNQTYNLCSSALVALCQFERLLLEVVSTDITRHDNQTLKTCIWQFENAIDGITKQISELVRLELVGYLPVSISAYTALPLVLHLLDVKLAPTQSVGALQQRRLGLFLELMRKYEPRFKEIENLWSTIRISLDFLAIESSPYKFAPRRVCAAPMGSVKTLLSPSPEEISSASSSMKSTVTMSPARDWREVFATNPYQFMPIVLLLDLAISQNKVPNRGDIFVRLPTNSALARLLPNPTSGPNISQASRNRVPACIQRIEEDDSHDNDSPDHLGPLACGESELELSLFDEGFLRALPRPLNLDFMAEI